jgi:hypothetical protein
MAYRVLLQKVFNEAQSFVMNNPAIKAVEAINNLLNRTVKLRRNQFVEMSKPSDLNRAFMVRGNRKVSALPKSRNFLMGVPFEELPVPIQKAFNLLGMSARIDELSANEVASAFQARDQYLLEKIGWNSTDLIRALNAFVEYDYSKKAV